MAKDNETTPLFQDSGWKFVTSEGANLGGGKGLYGFSSSSGSIYIARKDASEGDFTELRYRSVGATVGFSSPISFDFATKDMASEGVIYANPLKKPTLTLDDLTGAYLAYGFSKNTDEGRSWTLVLIGVGLGIVGGFLAGASGVGLPFAPAIVVGSCDAIIWYWGDFLGTPGVGVSASLGYIKVPAKEKVYPIDQMAG